MRSPDLLAGLRGPTSKERGREGDGRGKGREGERRGKGRGGQGKGREGEGRDLEVPPPSQLSGSAYECRCGQ